MEDVFNWGIGEVEDVMLNEDEVDGVLFMFVAVNAVKGVVRPAGFGDKVEEGWDREALRVRNEIMSSFGVGVGGV